MAMPPGVYVRRPRGRPPADLSPRRAQRWSYTHVHPSGTLRLYPASRVRALIVPLRMSYVSA